MLHFHFKIAFAFRTPVKSKSLFFSLRSQSWDSIKSKSSFAAGNWTPSNVEGEESSWIFVTAVELCAQVPLSNRWRHQLTQLYFSHSAKSFALIEPRKKLFHLSPAWRAIYCPDESGKRSLFDYHNCFFVDRNLFHSSKLWVKGDGKIEFCIVVGKFKDLTLSRLNIIEV